MSAIAALRAAPDFAELLAVSERMGRDPLQVQGPGGNTSLKRDGLMLVKASGTWLADAREREIMVAVRSGDLRAALVSGDPAAEKATGFALEGGDGLRPSIETTVHAALDRPVVLHTHCIATIAVAARADAAEVAAERLGDLGAVALPYVKPGLPLAHEILARATPETRVLVLGNHGLVVCGDRAAETEALAKEVAARLGRAPAPEARPAERFAAELAGTGWRPAPHGLTQAIAFDDRLLALAAGGSLFPDHVVFLGPGVLIARPGEPAADAVARADREAPRRKLVLVPGQGAAIPEDASPSVLAMARAFGDVLARIEPDAELVRLTPEQEAELMNWDAEKHRQALEAARSRGG